MVIFAEEHNAQMVYNGEYYCIIMKGGQSRYEIHSNVRPRTMRNGQRTEKTRQCLSGALTFGASGASGTKNLGVVVHQKLSLRKERVELMPRWQDNLFKSAH